MGATRRQHYVPRCYLKRFSFDGKFVHTFLLNQVNSKVLSREDLMKVNKDLPISNICESKDYYTLKNQFENVNPLMYEEAFFGKYAEPKLNSTIEIFDDLAKTILSEKTKIACFQITPEQKLDLLQSAFIQYFRTPKARRPFEEMNTIIKNINKASKRSKGQSGEDKIEGIDVAGNHARKTYMNLPLFSAFIKKTQNYLLLLRISENGNFFTSDNPVVIHKIGVRGKDILQVNIFQDEFSLFFPLTPYLILELYDPVVFPNSIGMNDTISIVDKKYENQVNRYQYVNAEKFVFSYKNDFSLFLKPYTYYGNLENEKR